MKSRFYLKPRTHGYTGYSVTITHSNRFLVVAVKVMDALFPEKTRYSISIRSCPLRIIFWITRCPGYGCTVQMSAPVCPYEER